MKKVAIGFWDVLAISAFYGLVAFLVEFLILLTSGSIGLSLAVLLAIRSSCLIMLVVAIIETIALSSFRVLDSLRPGSVGEHLQRTIMMGCGGFIIIFLWLFSLFSDIFEAFFGATCVVGVGFFLMGAACLVSSRSKEVWARFMPRSHKAWVVGAVGIIMVSGVSFAWTENTITTKNVHSKAVGSDRPNILLIVMDTVRADHLSIYGYHRGTSPFLEELARESTVFTNAFSPSPWTLPSHASLFTGLYPNQHGAHAEHFWLDGSFRTLAEILHEKGYQTVSFSNNDYVSSYHNLTQGFERCWYKGKWTDKIAFLPGSLGSSINNLLARLLHFARIEIQEKLIQNPASIWAYPSAGLTNKAISEWVNQKRDKSRPFFLFVNYMDAHLPYNPNDDDAKLFLNHDELKSSYRKNLRFPPIEVCLDLTKGQYSQGDLLIINSLYDACIHYLDGELKRLMEKIKNAGLYDNTLIIITSDHGEYLGTHNRLAHGLGLHDDVLRVPLIARFPGLFEFGRKCDRLASLVDITKTIVAFAKAEDRREAAVEAEVLYDLTRTSRSHVFAEFFFPLHLLINSSLRDDNSKLLIEQKSIITRTHRLIWKSRGDLELYNILTDPSQVNNLYPMYRQEAENMYRELKLWLEALPRTSLAKEEKVDDSKKETEELIKRLRGIGYVK